MTMYWAYVNKFPAIFFPCKPIILTHHVRLDLNLASDIVL